MRVIGRFRIGERIAEGAHAIVHAAHDVDEAAATLAAKVAKPGHADRLRSEWHRFCGVRHDRVLRPIALVESGHDVALVSPRAVHSLRHCTGALSEREVAGVLDDVASALLALHGTGLAHGDLRACNVLLDRDGRCVLADLGSAAPLTAEREAADAHALAQLSDQLLADAHVDSALGALLAATVETPAPTSVAQLRDQVRATGLEPCAPLPFDTAAFVVEPPTLALDVRRRTG